MRRGLALAGLYLAFSCVGVDREVGRYTPRIATGGGSTSGQGDGAAAGLGPDQAEAGMRSGDGGAGGAPDALGGAAGEQAAMGGVAGSQMTNGGGGNMPKTGKLLSSLNWRATASNEHPDAPAANAIDGMGATGYVSGLDQVVGMWFQIDMLQTQYVFSIQIDCNDYGSCSDPDATNTDLPAAINVAFSDTGNWADAEPVLSNQVVTPHENIALPQAAIGRYMRITLSQGKPRWWRMDEIRLWQ